MCRNNLFPIIVLGTIAFGKFSIFVDVVFYRNFTCGCVYHNYNGGRHITTCHCYLFKNNKKKNCLGFNDCSNCFLMKTFSCK